MIWECWRIKLFFKRIIQLKSKFTISSPFVKSVNPFWGKALICPFPRQVGHYETLLKSGSLNLVLLLQTSLQETSDSSIWYLLHLLAWNLSPTFCFSSPKNSTSTFDCSLHILCEILVPVCALSAPYVNKHYLLTSKFDQPLKYSWYVDSKACFMLFISWGVSPSSWLLQIPITFPA